MELHTDRWSLHFCFFFYSLQ